MTMRVAAALGVTSNDARFEKLRGWLRRTDLAVLIVGIGLSVGLGIYVARQAELAAKLRFANDTAETSDLIAARVRTYSDALAGLRGLLRPRIRSVARNSMRTSVR